MNNRKKLKFLMIFFALASTFQILARESQENVDSSFMEEIDRFDDELVNEPLDLSGSDYIKHELKSLRERLMDLRFEMSRSDRGGSPGP